MQVETYLPIKVEINYKQAINVLRSTVVDITERAWYGLTYSDVDHKVYHNHELLERLTEEEHEFVGSIIKLVKAQEKYEHPLVF
jgi:hypothetical protein